jgi:hypothetical protein
MDLNDTSPRTSAANSMTTRQSAASSVTSIGGGSKYDYLPPIRSPSPLNLPRVQPSMASIRDEYNDEESIGMYVHRQSLQKPLPEVPISIFDRLQAPLSFHPTRRAPLPPMLQSWIDLSDDESDDSSLSPYRSASPPHAVQATYQAPRPPTPPPMDQPAHQRIEKEIMRMLQFNEEKDGERRVEEKKLTRRKSNLNFGGFMGKLRRTMSVRSNAEWNENRRATYFDVMI